MVAIALGSEVHGSAPWLGGCISLQAQASTLSVYCVSVRLTCPSNPQPPLQAWDLQVLNLLS